MEEAKGRDAFGKYGGAGGHRNSMPSSDAISTQLFH